MATYMYLYCPEYKSEAKNEERAVTSPAAGFDESRVIQPIKI